MNNENVVGPQVALCIKHLDWTLSMNRSSIITPNVKGRISPPICSELRTWFQHGWDNEQHAQVTVAAYVLPAFYHPCKVLLETGPVFIDSPERKNVIEVSADWIIECRIGEEQCPYNKEGNRHETLVVEIKCLM